LLAYYSFDSWCHTFEAAHMFRIMILGAKSQLFFFERRKGDGIVGIEDKFSDVMLEKQVLAALMNHHDLYYQYAMELIPSVFSDSGNRKIFIGLKDYNGGGAELAAKRLEKEGVIPTSVDNIASAVYKLIDLAQRRTATKVIASIWRDIATNKPMPEIMSAAVAKLGEAQRSIESNVLGKEWDPGVLLEDALNDYSKAKELLTKTGRPTLCPSFGPEFRGLTYETGGLQPYLMVIGGPPGTGKTFLVSCWADRYLSAEKDTGVIWVDVGETRPVWKIANRLACIHYHINPFLVDRYAIPSDQLGKYYQLYSST